MITDRQISEAISNAVEDVYLPAIIAATPRKTGDTAENWKVLIESEQVFLVNIKFGDIVRFLEDGTQGPYEIKPKDKQSLKFNIGDRTIFTKKVIHPGIEARKFVFNMLNDERLKNDFIRQLDKYLSPIIEKL